MIDLISIPFPPSTNSCWRAIGRGRVISSAKYREFCAEVAGLVEPLGLTCRLEAQIVLHAPTRRKYDIDNRIKPLLDALESAGVFENDEQIDKLAVQRGPVWPRNGTALIWITESDTLQ